MTNQAHEDYSEEFYDYTYDAYMSQWDDDPSPYNGDYSEC